MEDKWIAALFIVISIGANSILLYDRDKSAYAVAGSTLTKHFHALRILYQQVKDQPANSDLPNMEAEHMQIQQEALKVGLSRQIFLSDWYAHYKFFWQNQIQWIDEQLHFTLVRDKMPLGMSVSIVCSLVFAVCMAIRHWAWLTAIVCGAPK